MVPIGVVGASVAWRGRRTAAVVWRRRATAIWRRAIIRPRIGAHQVFAHVRPSFGSAGQLEGAACIVAAGLPRLIVGPAGSIEERSPHAARRQSADVLQAIACPP